MKSVGGGGVRAVIKKLTNGISVLQLVGCSNYYRLNNYVVAVILRVAPIKNAISRGVKARWSVILFDEVEKVR